jgi:DME family drug/metabolite transporter
MKYLGEAFALSSAVCWAFSVVLFRKSRIDAPNEVLCIIRNLITFLLLLITCLFFENSFNQLIELTFNQIFVLALSGIIGIALADSFFFATIKKMDASLFGIFQCAYSPIVILISYFYLSESLSLKQFIGLLLVISSILLISTSSNRNKQKLSIQTIFFAILMVACNAISAVIAKPILENTDLIPAITLRSFFGIGILHFYLYLTYRGRIFKDINIIEISKKIILPTILGSYISSIFWLAGFKYTYASIASILNETSSLFIVILGVILLKEELTKIKIISTLLAMFGILLVINF